MDRHERCEVPAPAADRAPLGRSEGEPRAYEAPRLVVYGDVRQLTTKVGYRGKKDGGGSRRTGF
jgi:hypothetical protein